MNEKWYKAAEIRAIKTICQTAVAMIGSSTLISDIDISTVISASALSGILSIITSLAGLPEVNNNGE